LRWHAMLPKGQAPGYATGAGISIVGVQPANKTIDTMRIMIPLK